MEQRHVPLLHLWTREQDCAVDRSLVLKRRRRLRRGGQAGGQIGSESGERREPAVAAISASRADGRAASEIPSTQAELFWPKVSR